MDQYRDLNAAGVPYSGCQFHTAWTLVASVEEVLLEAGCEAKIRYADVPRGTRMDQYTRTIAIFIAVEPPSLTRRALEVMMEAPKRGSWTQTRFTMGHKPRKERIGTVYAFEAGRPNSCPCTICTPPKIQERRVGFDELNNTVHVYQYHESETIERTPTPAPKLEPIVTTSDEDDDCTIIEPPRPKIPRTGDTLNPAIVTNLPVIPASRMPPYPDNFRLHEGTDYPLDNTLTITAANGSRTVAKETKYTTKALDRQKQRLLDLGVLTADMPTCTTCTALLSHIQDIENQYEDPAHPVFY